jgi:hypothetical protein
MHFNLQSPPKPSSATKHPSAPAAKTAQTNAAKKPTPTTTSTPAKKSSTQTPPPSAKKASAKPLAVEEKKKAAPKPPSVSSSKPLISKPVASASKSQSSRASVSTKTSPKPSSSPQSLVSTQSRTGEELDVTIAVLSPVTVEGPPVAIASTDATASPIAAAVEPAAAPETASPDRAASPLSPTAETPVEMHQHKPDETPVMHVEPRDSATAPSIAAEAGMEPQVVIVASQAEELPETFAATPPASTNHDLTNTTLDPALPELTRTDPAPVQTPNAAEHMDDSAPKDDLAKDEQTLESDQGIQAGVASDSDSQPQEESKAPKRSKKPKKSSSDKPEGDKLRKGASEKATDKKKSKSHHKSDDAYSSDSAYNSDSASAAKRKKTSSRLPSTSEAVSGTKKKHRREKAVHDGESEGDDETTAAGFPAVPGLLVSVEEAADNDDIASATKAPREEEAIVKVDENIKRRHRFRSRTNTIDEGDLRSAKLQHEVSLDQPMPKETDALRVGFARVDVASVSVPDEADSGGKRSRPTLQRAARSYSALSQSSTIVAQFQESLKAKRASSTAPAASLDPSDQPPEENDTDSSTASVSDGPISAGDALRPRQPRRGASQGSGLAAAAGPSIGRVLVRQVPRNRGIPLKSSKEAEARLKAEEVERERRLNREKEVAAREAAENAEIEIMLGWESEISEGVATKRWEEMQKRKRKTVSLDSKLKSSPTKLQKGKSESRTSNSSSSSTSSSSPSKQARPKKIAFRAAPAILYERNQNPRALKFEEEDSEDNIRLKDFNNETRIAGGTVEKLIQRLTFDKLTDTNYLSTFLLTYRSFMTPKELLDILEVRWNTAPPAGTTNIDGWKTNVLYLIRLRISNVLKSWIEKYYDADFEGDSEILKQLDVFIDKVASSGLDKPAQQVRSMLEMKAEGKEKRSIEFSSATPRPRLAGIVPGKTSPKNLGFLDIDPLELARQLTSTEYRLFKAIAYKELLGTKWTKKDKTKESPHVVEALSFSDRIVDWVATCILNQQDRTKRAQTLCRFISISKLLLRMNNFNSAFEILSGLRSLGIMRLKRTWNMLPSAAWSSFEELERVFDPDGNWKRYREALESAAPAVPHLHLFLSELIYINDKHPDTIANGADAPLINFEKMWLIADIINKIQHYQEISYNILPVSIIEDYLVSCDIISALDQHEVSLAREPEK